MNSAGAEKSVQQEYHDLILQHFDSTADDVDWHRYDFSEISVAKLRECVQHLRSFSLGFTRMSNPELNKETTDLLFAIELEIRRRPSREQYPEIWEPLVSAIKTLDLTAKLQKETQDDFKQILGWQRNHDSYLEPVFTRIALEHLIEKKPRNIIINIFQDRSISKKWTSPDFEIDGLIYDQTDRIFYIVESKSHLTEDGISKAVTTFEKFRRFINEPMPSTTDRVKLRRWKEFFDADSGIVVNKEGEIMVSVFLGYHSIEDECLLTQAAAKQFTLVGPDGSHYRVMT